MNVRQILKVISRVAAEKFAQRGCQVFGTVRSIAKAQAIPGVEFVEMDVRDETSFQKAIQTIVEQSKQIDVLVNNAGFLLLGSVEETSVKGYSRKIADLP